MPVHEISVFGRQECPFFALLGDSFLFDDMLYGPAHQAGSSRHQHSHRRGGLALLAHLVWQAQDLDGAQNKRVYILVCVCLSRMESHKGSSRVIRQGFNTRQISSGSFNKRTFWRKVKRKINTSPFVEPSSE